MINDDPYIGKIVRSVGSYDYASDNPRIHFRYPADSVFVVLGIDEETSYYILKPLQNDSKNLNVDKIPVQCYGLFGKAQFSNRHYFDIIDEDN